MKFWEFDSGYFSFSGRIDPSSEGMELLWPGTTVSFNVRSQNLNIKLAYHGNNGNYMRVLVDGKTIKQFKVEQGIHEYVLLENQDQESLYTQGKVEDFHEITLYKQTGILAGGVIFMGVSTEDDGQVIASPSKNQLKMEIYGDSITVGGNVHGEYEEGYDWNLHTNEDHYLSYGALIARHFDAKLHTTAICGTGVVVGWNEGNMPDYWDKVQYDLNSTPWDFRKYQPDLVLVNLGQNDCKSVFFDQEPFPRDDFIKTYVKLIQDIRGVYPRAYIGLIPGGMSGIQQEDLRAAFLESVRILELDDDRIAHHIIVSSQTGMHPGVREHTAMAKELIDWLDEKGWFRGQNN